jgi:hypothetical protein
VNLGRTLPARRPHLLQGVRSPRATQAAIQITTPDPELVGRSSSRTASARAILLVLAALASSSRRRSRAGVARRERPVAQVNGHQPTEQLAARFNGDIVLYRAKGRPPVIGRARKYSRVRQNAPVEQLVTQPVRNCNLVTCSENKVEPGERPVAN